MKASERGERESRVQIHFHLVGDSVFHSGPPSSILFEVATRQANAKAYTAMNQMTRH